MVQMCVVLLNNGIIACYLLCFEERKVVTFIDVNTLWANLTGMISIRQKCLHNILKSVNGISLYVYLYCLSKVWGREDFMFMKNILRSPKVHLLDQKILFQFLNEYFLF